MKEEKTQNETIEKIKKQVEEKIKTIADNGIKSENLDNLYKLIDIHKDISNEEYWKVKEEGEMNEMRYGNYDEYNGYYGEDSYGRRQRDSRGRYMDGGSYGRRGVPGTGRGRYRGHDYLDDMYETYGEYSEGRERYGANQDTMQSFEYMLKSFKDFFKHLEKEASSQEEVEMLKKTAREISQM